MGFIRLPDEGEGPKVHISSLLDPEWDLKQITHCSEACPKDQDTLRWSGLKLLSFNCEGRTFVWWLKHPLQDEECDSCSANVDTEQRSCLGCSLHGFALRCSLRKTGFGPFGEREKMLAQSPSD